MFKVVFIVPVSVHGPEFKRSECMYLKSQYLLSNLERWALNERDFNAIFLFTEVKAAEAEAEIEVEMEVVM